MKYLKRAFKRMSILVLMLVFFVCALPIMPAPESAAGYVGVVGDDYPSRYKGAAKDALVDEWRFYNRECVSFVAWRLNSQNGISFHNYYKGVHWGNGSNWKAAAQSLGITVDKKPARGAVYWKSTHVAWVSGVSGSDVTIEEYNYDHEGHYRYRNVQKGAEGVYYIHIKDKSSASGFDLENATLSGLSKKYKYTGNKIVPNVSVSLGDKSLVRGSAYTVTCSSNKNIGKATIKIKGKGAYKGTVKKTFKIVPKGTSIISLRSGAKNTITAGWNKQAVQTDGYQLKYSSDKSMQNAAKRFISGNSTTGTTITGLTGGRTYYFRIRTYKWVGLKKYYSKWCRIKTVQVK